MPQLPNKTFYISFYKEGTEDPSKSTPTGILPLQYDPATLKLLANNQSQSIAGVRDLITYISSPNSSSASINVSAYFTAIDNGKTILPTLDLTGVSTNVALGAAAAGLTASSVLFQETAVTAQAVIGLAKGAYDLVSGTISRTTPALLPTGSYKEALKALNLLSLAAQQSQPVILNWDMLPVFNQTDFFYISNYSVDTQSINDFTSNTMEFILDLTFNKMGVMIKDA